MNLTNNTIFITGGSSGIGQGLAEAFHKLGNRVIIGGRRSDALDAITAAHPGMDSVAIDTASATSVEAAAVEVLAKHPDLNVVINNAGIQRVFDFATAIPSDEELGVEIDTNIKGVVRMTAAFLPHLKTRPGAALVNVTSGLAFLPIARFPIYCATKAFCHSFTMSLRLQLKGTGVRVIELAPPWVKTNLDALVPASHQGIQPMPLADFIAAAMAELASGEDELKVAGAKFLYSGGISERAAAVFEQINQ